MKKRKKVLIVIGIVILFLAAVPFAINEYKKMKVLAGMSNEEYLVFSTDFISRGDLGEGTFKYYISSGKIEKISEHILSDFSYSDDHKYIIGTVNDEIIGGLVEIELSSNKLNRIIDFNEIDALLSKMGMDKLKYRYFRVLSLRPKYYKSGYTFYNDMFEPDTLLYLEKKGDSWNMEKLYRTENKTYSYFIKEGNKEDTLFLGIQEDNYTGKGYIMEKGLSSGKEDVLFKLFIYSTYKRGRMDMTGDKNKLVYYEYPYICMYNLEKEQVENMIEIKPGKGEYVVDLKFSPDGKYLFYTFGKDPFFPGTPRLRFMVLNLETKQSVELKRWADGDNFYGVDW